MSETTTSAPKPIDFRKKITSPFHINQINALVEEWGISKSDCLWRILTKGIVLEKERRAKAKERDK